MLFKTDLYLVMQENNCLDSEFCNCANLHSSIQVKYLDSITGKHLIRDEHVQYLCTIIRKTIYKCVQLRLLC